MNHITPMIQSLATSLLQTGSSSWRAGYSTSNEKRKTNTVQAHPHRPSRCTSIYSPDFRSHSSQPNSNHLISYNNILLLYSQIPVAGLRPP